MQLNKRKKTKKIAEMELKLKLKQIGLSGKSIEVKFVYLNYLWNKFYVENSKIDFTQSTNLIENDNKEAFKFLRKFLNLLNSILNSMTKLILGVEPMIEIKDLIENIFSFEKNE